jgi:hypothetical protein
LITFGGYLFFCFFFLETQLQYWGPQLDNLPQEKKHAIWRACKNIPSLSKDFNITHSQNINTTTNNNNNSNNQNDQITNNTTSIVSTTNHSNSEIRNENATMKPLKLPQQPSTLLFPPTTTTTTTTTSSSTTISSPPPSVPFEITFCSLIHYWTQNPVPHMVYSVLSLRLNKLK